MASRWPTHRCRGRRPLAATSPIAFILLTVLSGIVSTAAQSREAPAYRLEVPEHQLPPTLSRSERVLVPVTIRNAGAEPWRRAEAIGLSYHWTDETGASVVFDGLRTRLHRDVEPGQSLPLCATIVAPSQPGRYRLQWDAVYEGRFWFSQRGGVDATPVVVEVGVRAQRPRSVSRLARVAAFWALTLAPLLVAAVWLSARRASATPSWDDYLFDTSLLGFGHLFVALQLLVFSIGLSLVGVAAALALTYVAVAAWRTSSVDPRTGTAHAPTTSATTSWQLSAGDIVGLSIALVLVFQWCWQASATAEVSGTDAAHYHVPHAVNFLRGLRPTDYSATPHLYPMGTSVWAAWFMLPFDGPLLVDLATLPAFVLLMTSSALIFRVLTGRSGLCWVPWLVLVTFSGFLPRLSLLMSADLSYSAGMLATAATVLRLWRDRAVSPRTLLCAGIAAGWLLGAKSTGLMSLAVIAASAVLVGVAIRRERGQIEGFTVGSVLVAAVAAGAAGGLWLVRNWVAFGSPVAPYGLSLFGIQIFAGPPVGSFREYLSVIGDLKRHADYPLAHRFLEAIVQMFGSWVFWIPLAIALLPADALVQRLRGRAIAPTTRQKVAFALCVTWAFAIHAYVIAALPWTSLDWTRNLSVRYLLPFYFLFLLTAFSFLFTDGLKWDGSRTGRLLGWTLIAGGSLWHATQHRDTGNLPADAWLLVVDASTITAGAILSIALLAYWWTARRVHLRHAPIVGLCAAGLVLVLARHGVTDYADVEMVSARFMASELSCAASRVPAEWEHRGLYLETLAYQDSARLRCPRTRFFLASRFDRPLDLQDAHFRNAVIDLSVRSRGSTSNRTPQSGGCDVVVVRASDVADRGEGWLDSLLGERYTLKSIATYGRYEAYVRP